MNLLDIKKKSELVAYAKENNLINELNTIINFIIHELKENQINHTRFIPRFWFINESKSARGDTNLYKKYVDKCRAIKATSSIEAFHTRFGEVEGQRRFEEYSKRQAYTNSKEYHGMTDEEFKQYNQSRAVTLDNMIKKHGEEKGIEKFNNYCVRQSYTNSKDYFIEKYGDKGEELWLACNKAKGHSYIGYVEKYGEVDGEKRFIKFVKNVSPCVSQESQDLFDEIDSFLTTEELEYSIREYYIIDKVNNKVYFYDYVNTNLGICIEYNGSNWHGNPAIYKDNDRPLLSFGKNLTAKELQQRDEIKKQKLLESRTFIKQYIVIWDKDLKEERDKVLEHMKEVINESRRTKV